MLWHHEMGSVWWRRSVKGPRLVGTRWLLLLLLIWHYWNSGKVPRGEITSSLMVTATPVATTTSNTIVTATTISRIIVPVVAAATTIRIVSITTTSTITAANTNTSYVVVPLVIARSTSAAFIDIPTGTTTRDIITQVTGTIAIAAVATAACN